MKPTDPQDEQVHLLSRVSELQCSNSFKKLFSIYAPKILAYGLANKLSESASRDLTQETMTIVWTKAHLYSSDRGNVASWIFTIARNIKFDLLRKHVRESKVISSSDLWDLESQIEDFNPTNDLEQRISNKELTKHIEDLPSAQSDAIKAIYYEGLTQEEFAQQEKLPLGTVKSRVRLAIQKLHSLMRST